MKVLIFGATGLIGSECLRQAIADEEIEQITVVLRRSLTDQINSTKVHVIIHDDFLDYSSLSQIFESHQACIWALGVSQNAVNEVDYIKITHDYTLAAAQAMARVNVDLRFVFVSGLGADSSERSRFLFGRIKGKTENDLVKESNLKEIYTVRPATVLSSHVPSTKAWYERMLMPIANIFKVLKPSWVIDNSSLARAILYLAKHGHHATLFENEDIKHILIENRLLD